MRRNPLSLFMLGGIALAVWHGAYTKAADATPGQEKVRAGAPQTLIKPSSGAPQSATPHAVCTFASIGLYWTPDGGADDKPCRVRYRAIGEPAWREALPLWFDKRIGEYRGSIVQLRSGTTYDVRLELAGGGPATELRAATWSEMFPVACTVPVDDMTGNTLTVDQSGTAAGYVLYTHRAGAATATIDAADQMDHCIEVKAFHNTILQPAGPPEARGTVGCAEGLNQSGGPELLSVVSRNNILHVRHKDGYSIRQWSKEPDYDYDLISGKVVSAGKQESHGIVGVPVYATSRPAGDFSLAPGSPGFDAGVPIPNFNDGFHGRAPDMGACEAGAAPLEFGVNAYRNHASRGRQSK